MIRNIIKGTKGSGEHRFATIDEAIMFIKLFGEQIEDDLRNTLMNEVRNTTNEVRKMWWRLYWYEETS